MGTSPARVNLKPIKVIKTEYFCYGYTWALKPWKSPFMLAYGAFRHSSLKILSKPVHRPVESGEPQLGLEKHYRGAPLRRNFWNFSFQNGAFWCTLYFWATAGPPPRPAGKLPPAPLS